MQSRNGTPALKGNGNAETLAVFGGRLTPRERNLGVSCAIGRGAALCKSTQGLTAFLVSPIRRLFTSVLLYFRSVQSKTVPQRQMAVSFIFILNSSNVYISFLGVPVQSNNFSVSP